MVLFEIAGKRIVSRIPAIASLIPLKQGEMRHPAKRELVCIGEFKHLAEMLSKGGKRFRDDGRCVGHKEAKIAFRSAEAGRERFKLCLQ